MATGTPVAACGRQAANAKDSQNLSKSALARENDSFANPVMRRRS